MAGHRTDAMCHQAPAGAEDVDHVLRLRRVRTNRRGGELADPRTSWCCWVGTPDAVGEMIALEWCDLDLVKRQICVRRSDWNGQVTTPKGGRLRHVPLTKRLAAAVRRAPAPSSVRLSARTTPNRSRARSSRPARNTAARRAGLTRRGCISCVIRSARISQCAARRLEQSRNWRATRTCR